MSELERKYRFFIEYLSSDRDDSHIDYPGILSSAEKRIDRLDSEPELFLAKEEIRGEGFYNSIENSLISRIVDYEEFDKPVQEAIQTDSVKAEPNYYDESDKRVCDSILSFSSKEEWEKELMAEVIIPEGRWERIQEGLESKIGSVREQGKSSVFSYTSGFLKAAAVAALAVIPFFNDSGFISDKDLQVSVTAASGEGTAHSLGEDLRDARASDNGEVVLVNGHGYCRLRNGSSLSFRNNSERFSSMDLQLSKRNQGSAEFFVEESPLMEGFRVDVNGAFGIVVTGTFFRVAHSVDNNIVVMVEEGSLFIETGDGIRVPVRAGEIFRYNPADRSSWSVSGGGMVVSRDSVAEPPVSGDSELMIMGRGAESVVLDSTLQYDVPVSLLVSSGPHRLRVEMKDGRVLDTVVDVSHNRTELVFPEESNEFVSKKPEPETRNERNKRKGSRSDKTLVTEEEVAHTGSEKGSSASSPAVEDKDSGPDMDSLISVADSTAKKGNTDSAESIYRDILRMEDVSEIIEQIALFSLGKMYLSEAEKTENALSVFRDYVSEYPEGIFAGEIYIRLAELYINDHPDSTVYYYNRFVDLNPDDMRTLEIRYKTGLIYLQQQEYMNARSVLKDLLEAMPDTHRLYPKVKEGLKKSTRHM